MERIYRKHMMANLIGLLAVAALGVLFTVYSSQIYNWLSGVTFLRSPEPSATPGATGPVWNITYGNYKPGTYQAVVYGYESDITATVEVSETEILSLKINATGESKLGIDAAKAIKEEILRTQTAEVDAISGATYTSKAAIDAVKTALQQASAG